MTRGARCYLAQQQERVVASMLAAFPEQFSEHLAKHRPSARCELLAPIVDIVAGQAILDSSHRRKQPDWTYGPRRLRRLPRRPLHQRARPRSGPPEVTEEPAADEGARRRPRWTRRPVRRDLALGHRRIQESIARVRAAGSDSVVARPGSARPSPPPARPRRRHDRCGLPDAGAGGRRSGRSRDVAPETQIRDALHRLEHLLRIGTPPSPGELDVIAELAVEHHEAYDRQVLPMLRERLDESHLAALARRPGDGDGLAGSVTAAHGRPAK